MYDGPVAALVVAPLQGPEGWGVDGVRLPTHCTHLPAQFATVVSLVAGDTATDTHLRQVQRVVGAEIFCKHFEHQRPWKVLRLKQLSEDNLYLSSTLLVADRPCLSHTYT